MDGMASIWHDFKKGDPRAIEEVYNRYVDILFRYGSKVSADRELVKDSIQQLFLELISSRGLSNPANIEFYLLKGLKRIIINQLKKQVKRNELTPEVLVPFEIEFTHDESLSEKDTQLFELLDEELKKLPAMKKELLFLKFYSGLTNDEIGKIVGMNSATVQKQIYRLLRQFGVTFKEKMILLLAVCYKTQKIEA